jgi:hypothetical protein
MAELVFAPQLPAFVTGVASDVGYDAPSVLVTLTPEGLLVQVTGLSSVDAAMLTPGGVAELEMPDGTVATGSVLSMAPASGGDLGVDVSVEPDVPVDFGLAGVNVKVTFPTAQTVGEVLAVPQGAITSDSAGMVSVIVTGEVDPATGQLALSRVPVSVGVSGGGLVEVTPVEEGALEAGARVVVSG